MPSLINPSGSRVGCEPGRWQVAPWPWPYDLAATTLTDVTLRFADHVQGLPFVPVFVLGGGHTPLSIGLGDPVVDWRNGAAAAPVGPVRCRGHQR